MATINPVSDLRNYNTVLEKVSYGSPVYLTVNGRGKYTERYLNDLMDIVESKSEYPLSGAPLYYEDRFTGYYYVVFKECLAFYRLESKRILVDRVLFGRSDYIRILQLGTDQ